MQTEHIPWVAGLMEGEASFGLNLNPTTRDGKTWNYWYLRVQLGMSDLDVVERAQEVLGNVGKISVRERKTSYKNNPKKKHKTMYVLNITKQTEAYAVMVAILPFMGKRRTEDITDALTSWLSIKPKRIDGHCKNGHRYTKSNTFVDTKGYKRCRTCQRETARKSRKKSKETL